MKRLTIIDGVLNLILANKDKLNTADVRGAE